MSKLFKAHKPKPAKAQKAPAPVRPPEAAAAKTKPGDPATLPPESWPKEIGGPEGPEPTRYGDWERKGICSDF